jgi:hypothetical protein
MVKTKQGSLKGISFKPWSWEPPPLPPKPKLVPTWDPNNINSWCNTCVRLGESWAPAERIKGPVPECAKCKLWDQLWLANRPTQYMITPTDRLDDSVLPFVRRWPSKSKGLDQKPLF